MESYWILFSFSSKRVRFVELYNRFSPKILSPLPSNYSSQEFSHSPLFLLKNSLSIISSPKHCFFSQTTVLPGTMPASYIEKIVWQVVAVLFHFATACFVMIRGETVIMLLSLAWVAFSPLVHLYAFLSTRRHGDEQIRRPNLVRLVDFLGWIVLWVTSHFLSKPKLDTMLYAGLMCGMSGLLCILMAFRPIATDGGVHYIVSHLIMNMSVRD